MQKRILELAVLSIMFLASASSFAETRYLTGLDAIPGGAGRVIVLENPSQNPVMVTLRAYDAGGKAAKTSTKEVVVDPEQTLELPADVVSETCSTIVAMGPEDFKLSVAIAEPCGEIDAVKSQYPGAKFLNTFAEDSLVCVFNAESAPSTLRVTICDFDGRVKEMSSPLSLAPKETQTLRLGDLFGAESLSTAATIELLCSRRFAATIITDDSQTGEISSASPTSGFSFADLVRNLFSTSTARGGTVSLQQLQKAATATLYPLSSRYRAVSFGYRAYNSAAGYHTGNDYKAPASTPVYSILPGGSVVYNYSTDASLEARGHHTAYAKYWNAFLIVRYPVNGSYLYVYFGHVLSNLPGGAAVGKGQQIAVLREAYTSGGTRSPSTDHLHLSVNASYRSNGWGYAPTSQGVVDAGWLNPASTFVFVPPSAPTYVRATDGTYTDRVVVTWNPVEGAGYNVFRSTSSSGTKTGLVCTGQTYFTDYQVTRGITYYYWIKSVSAAGDQSGYSAADSGYRR